MLAHFATARARREELAKRPSDVEDVLRDGAKRVREQVGPLVDQVRSVCGVGPISR